LSQVTSGHVERSFTLASGAASDFRLDWVEFNKDRWQRVSITPDSFPSSIQVESEWSTTDVGNNTTLWTTLRNTGIGVGVFRLGYLLAPGI